MCAARVKYLCRPYVCAWVHSMSASDIDFGDERRSIINHRGQWKFGGFLPLDHRRRRNSESAISAAWKSCTEDRRTTHTIICERFIAGWGVKVYMRARARHAPLIPNPTTTITPRIPGPTTVHRIATYEKTDKSDAINLRAHRVSGDHDVNRTAVAYEGEWARSHTHWGRGEDEEFFLSSFQVKFVKTVND